MSPSRVALTVFGGVALALAVGIAVLLIYYRPTVEYAYVDVLDLREKGSWSSIVLTAGFLALLIAGFVTWRFARRSRPR